MKPNATARLQDILSAHQPDWYAAQRAIHDGANLDAPLVDDPGRTLLVNACHWNRMGVARWLIEKGANPNASSRSNRHKPLREAAIHGHTEIIRLLLEGHANIEARDRSGWTALAYAVWQNHRHSTALLLAHGANPNARGPRGETPLMGAANGALIHDADTRIMFDLLLDHGLDPSVADDAGRTLPEFFASVRRENLAAMLDTALTAPPRATARRRLLDRLTAAQRTAWLPKSCAVEAVCRSTKIWSRKP